MKNFKNNKGITLIALIITIIVLLILAVIAISAVQGDGIIAHAKNARDSYQTAQETENTVLAGYLTDIENANNNEIRISDNNVIFIIYKREGNDDIIIISKSENDLSESERNIVDELLDIDEYYSWNKTSKGDVTTYARTFLNRENEECTSNVIFGFNGTVNNEYIGDLSEKESIDYWNVESEYYYSNCCDDDNERYWHVSTIEDKELYTEEFKTEILGYQVSAFNHLFNDSIVRSIPTIPITAKEISEMFSGCDNISEVNYAGTLEQYKKISCYNYISDKNGFTVHCTDGNYIVGNN